MQMEVKGHGMMWTEIPQPTCMEGSPCGANQQSQQRQPRRVDMSSHSLLRP